MKTFRENSNVLHITWIPHYVVGIDDDGGFLFESFGRILVHFHRLFITQFLRSETF